MKPQVFILLATHPKLTSSLLLEFSSLPLSPGVQADRERLTQLTAELPILYAWLYHQLAHFG